MSAPDWFTVLGLIWVHCDNLGEHWPALRQRFSVASREHLDCMMRPDERRALDALPADVWVSRGCYEHNVDGLSWSRDRETAMKIPFFERYLQRQPAVLLTGVARRERCVLKLERGENEIICADVDVRVVTPIWREYRATEDEQDAIVGRVLTRLAAGRRHGPAARNRDLAAGA